MLPLIALLQRGVSVAIISFLVLGTADAFGQDAALRGVVRDLSSGEPLPTVNVALRSGEKLLKGAITDADGYYYIARIAPGPYSVSASYIGYQGQTQPIVLTAGAVETLNFQLNPATISGQEVVIESEQPRSVMNNAGLQIIRPEQIEMIPVPDVSADLMGYLQILPGMLTTGDRGGQLFVRGGTPSQNLTLIDGIPVHQPFHIIGFFSAFPSEIVRQSSVYAGGFGAEYGGRVSSVIDVTTRNGNKNDFEGSASVAPFLTALHIEGPVELGETSILLSLRESLVERVFPDFWSGSEPFRFGDEFAKVHAKLRDGSELSATFLRTHDRGLIDETEAYRSDDFGLTEDLEFTLPEEEVGWSNHVYGLRYFVLPEGNTLPAELNLSISLLRDWAGPVGDPERRSRLWSFQTGAKMTRVFGDVKVHYGAGMDLVLTSFDLDGTFQDYDSDDENYVNAGPYVDLDWPVGSRLVLHPGMQVHAFIGAKSAIFPEPRFRAQWHPFGLESSHRISAAWGLYHQNLVGLKDERDAGDVFTAWTFAPYRSEITDAMHALVGWNSSPVRSVEIGIEAFYKTMGNLSVPAWSALPKFTTIIIPADAEVVGADLRLSFDSGPLYGFVGYGLQRVVYTAKQGSFGVWYGTSQQEYTPPHDRRHTLNALLSTDLGGWDVDVRWEFGSGFPYTRPIGFDDWIMFETLVDVTKDPGQYRVLFERPYQGRLPTYHRLDISVKYTFEFPRVRLTLQGGAVNTYDRDNLFYFDVWRLRRVDQMSRMATFGVKVATR